MDLRFRDSDVRRSCCDLRLMRERGGAVAARRLSRRLQQLEAMTSLADLAFLPFVTSETEDGAIEVVVTDHLSLLLERGSTISEEDNLMDTVTIIEVRNSATTALSR